jgi:predicted membrane-bound mannosyltransferase
MRCNRATDRYQWVSAHVLDAGIGAALDHHDEAARLVDALTSVVARGDMRELLVRAHLYRSRLGDPSALATARLLAATIDNPALAPLLDGRAWAHAQGPS